MRLLVSDVAAIKFPLRELKSKLERLAEVTSFERSYGRRSAPADNVITYWVDDAADLLARIIEKMRVVVSIGFRNS